MKELIIFLSHASVMQIEKALINYRIPTICNFAVIYFWHLLFY